MDGLSEAREITILSAEDEGLLRKLLKRTIGSKVEELNNASNGVPLRRRLVDAFVVGGIFTNCTDLIDHLEQLPEAYRGDLVIITDYQTPGEKNGADVAKWCLEHSVPCLVYTGTAHDYLANIKELLTEEQRAIAERRVLNKPASADEMRVALVEILKECFPDIANTSQPLQQV